MNDGYLPYLEDAASALHPSPAFSPFPHSRLRLAPSRMSIPAWSSVSSLFPPKIHFHMSIYFMHFIASLKSGQSPEGILFTSSLDTLPARPLPAFPVPSHPSLSSPVPFCPLPPRNLSRETPEFLTSCQTPDSPTHVHTPLPQSTLPNGLLPEGAGAMKSLCLMPQNMVFHV